MQLTQTIVIIVLVIIGIILFIVLLVELVDIPQPLIVPFADGTIIKIKSLANNLYLRPVGCTDISSCTAPFVQEVCDTFPNGTGVIVSPIGQVTDPLTNWQLCQYSSLSDEGEAKYLIYSKGNDNTFILSLSTPILTLVRADDICTGLKSNPINCNPTAPSQTYFSFILNEQSAPGLGVNTTSGAYNIFVPCGTAENSFLLTSGQGATTLPANVCPPIVSSQLGQSFNCEQPNGNPSCSLSYLFSIEVQS